jgi:hypothetical protein
MRAKMQDDEEGVEQKGTKRTKSEEENRRQEERMKILTGWHRHSAE